MFLTTGAEIQTIMSKIVAENKRKVPKWWKKPVRAMVVDFFLLSTSTQTQTQLFGLVNGFNCVNGWMDEKGEKDIGQN